jgi:hypothetical protein
MYVQNHFMIIIKLQFHLVEVELKNGFVKSLKKIDSFSSISVMNEISGVIPSTAFHFSVLHLMATFVTMEKVVLLKLNVHFQQEI